MPATTLEGVESIRVIRADGNLRIECLPAPAAIIESGEQPQIERDGGRAGIILRSSATLTVPPGTAIEIEELAGNLEAEGLATPLAIGHIRGNLYARYAGAIAIRKAVGGSVEAEQAGGIEGGVVGGRVRVTGLAGSLRIEKIGGKLVADGVAGEIAAGFVGGRVRLGRIAGDVRLEEIGGAVDITGPLPAAKSWRLRSRGRVSVELDPEASIELEAASSRWGRIRVHGIDAGGLQWRGRNHAHGTIGAEPAGGARMQLAIETRGADVIITGNGAHAADFCGRSHRRAGIGRAFAAPFEDFVGELGEDVPAFVRKVLDAAGAIVAESGEFSGAIVREVTRDVQRSVSDGIREVERTLGKLGAAAPAAAGETLARLGREIAEFVSRAPSATRDERHQMRDHVRRTVREMRDTIRTAAKGRRARGHEERRKPDQPQAAAGPGREDSILEILAAVKAGRIEPEAADDLIGAWIAARDAAARPTD